MNIPNIPPSRELIEAIIENLETKKRKADRMYAIGLALIVVLGVVSTTAINVWVFVVLWFMTGLVPALYGFFGSKRCEKLINEQRRSLPPKVEERRWPSGPRG